MARKIWCEWCHAMTFDDQRGHCLACGGPREYEYQPVYPTYPGFVTVPVYTSGLCLSTDSYHPMLSSHPLST